MTATQRKQALRHDIMNVIKANNLEVSGEFWLMLIFRTESELKEIARGIHVKAA
jgi:predicted neuraminidase